MRGLLAVMVLAAGPAAAADEKLTAVSRDGLYYRLDSETVCKALPVGADGAARGWPECQRVARKAHKRMGLEAPRRARPGKGRRLEARLIAARPDDAGPDAGPPKVDPLFGKPIKKRDDRLAVVATDKDGREEIVAYWAGHPEVVAVEDLFLSPDRRTAVVIYNHAFEVQAKVILSAVGFRLR